MNNSIQFERGQTKKPKITQKPYDRSYPLEKFVARQRQVTKLTYARQSAALIFLRTRSVEKN